MMHIEAEGNLESTHPIECVDINTLNNQHTPADLYPAVIKCINEGNYDLGFALFAMAGAYGHFDSNRVSDSSARQAITVLIMNNMSTLTKEKQEAWKNAIKEYADETSSKFNQVCSHIRKISHPDYYPRYMVQHGMNALTGPNSTPLKSDFNSEEAWQKALNGYLHCPTI